MGLLFPFHPSIRQEDNDNLHRKMKNERGCIVMELCAVLLYRVLKTGTRG